MSQYALDEAQSLQSGTVCLIVLAAGLSTRMGSRDKLQLPLREKTVLEHTVAAAVEARLGEVLVVTGSHDYGALLESYPVRFVRNPDYEKGMASSIRVGVESAGPDASAFGIVLGDMPFIRPVTIADLAGHLDSAGIVVPYFDDAPGHPVLFGKRYRRDLIALRGDVGARSVVQANTSDLVRVDTGDPGVVRDIDTAEAYRRA